MPDAIEVEWSLDETGLTWSVANRSDQPVAVDAVAVVTRLEPVVEPLRVLRHGYQSWSPTGGGHLPRRPGRLAADGVRSLPIGMHHADWATSEPDELRSELVTVLRDDTGGVLVAGFLGGWEHDGTFRVRPARDGDDGIELWIEAFLGGAVWPPANVGSCTPSPSPRAMASRPPSWRAGRAPWAPPPARTSAPYQVGWCSWYHYFHDVTEADLRSNLARAGEWPFDVFQLDDGFQAAIGDWLDTNAKFPTAIDGLAAAIAAEGRTPGIWIAPFLAGADSEVARAHPDWLAGTPPRHPTGRMVNDGWGGAVNTLDTSNPEVLAHLEQVARPSWRPATRTSSWTSPTPRRSGRLRRPQPHARPARPGGLRCRAARRR